MRRERRESERARERTKCHRGKGQKDHYTGIDFADFRPSFQVRLAILQGKMQGGASLLLSPTLCYAARCCCRYHCCCCIARVCAAACCCSHFYCTIVVVAAAAVVVVSLRTSLHCCCYTQLPARSISFSAYVKAKKRERGERAGPAANRPGDSLSTPQKWDAIGTASRERGERGEREGEGGGRLI